MQYKLTHWQCVTLASDRKCGLIDIDWEFIESAFHIIGMDVEDMDDEQRDVFERVSTALQWLRRGESGVAQYALEGHATDNCMACGLLDGITWNDGMPVIHCFQLG